MAITLNDKEYKMRKLGIKDVFACSRILNKMNLKEEFRELAVKGAEMSDRANKGEDVKQMQIELGIDMMYAVLSNIGAAESEFFEWLASIYKTSVPQLEYYLDDQLEAVVSDFMENEGKEGFLNSVKGLLKLTK
ncbi:hypothetical protein [Bacillus multifaciens]|uniref:hypothetical protein n=1 Tax=Bacillus multifaciens TaxID=3068506 RepID=UPI0027409B36|nr:hypothetical protein [Bacillus sp. WLY-B-L8]MDP7981037.1 hypothetical protein [Bacillus sp. WLY-B-L8]